MVQTTSISESLSFESSLTSLIFVHSFVGTVAFGSFSETLSVAPVAFAMPYLASSMAKYVRHGYLALTVSPKPYFAQVKSDFALYIYLVISRY